MDPLLAIVIARALLLNTRNLLVEVRKAKSGDGKITVDELPEVAINTLLKTMDDLGVGIGLQELGKGVKI